MRRKRENLTWVGWEVETVYIDDRKAGHQQKYKASPVAGKGEGFVKGSDLLGGPKNPVSATGREMESRFWEGRRTEASRSPQRAAKGKAS